MKFISGLLVGAGIGAATVNLTLVPHGHNQGLFFGAVSILIGVVIHAINQLKGKD